MLKVLVGIVVGLGYGVLVGGMMLLIYFLSSDPPVDLMLDYNKMFRFLILLAMIITGSAGALVGFLVTLLRAGKLKAGMIGFGVGLVVLAAILFKISPQLKTDFMAVSWSSLSIVFLFFLALMIMFPLGLAATGVAASVVTRMSASTR
jgi:hypothetical protein